jgi:hypothetical protein
MQCGGEVIMADPRGERLAELLRSSVAKFVQMTALTLRGSRTYTFVYRAACRNLLV